MKEQEGWIRLHRKMLKKGWAKNPEYMHLWIHLLLFACYEDHEFLWENKIILIKRGQLITGRKSLSVNSGISESKVERILKCFESEQQIEQQKTNKFRLITIINYDQYQQSEQQNEQQVNNKRTTSEQQMDTYNELKNIKKEKNKEEYKEIQDTYVAVKNKPQHVLLVDNFKLAYLQKTGVEYNDQKKDYIISAQLVKKFGYDLCVQKIQILGVLCEKKSSWFTEGGWSDFTIGKLLNNWNNILPSAHNDTDAKKKEEEEKYEKKWRESNERANKILNG
jgi:hypothetical protein